MQSAPFYASTDGLLFVVKSGREEGREMTPAEETKFNTSQFEFHVDAKGERKATAANQGNKEQGIKIQVVKKVEE